MIALAIEGRSRRKPDGQVLDELQRSDSGMHRERPITQRDLDSLES